MNRLKSPKVMTGIILIFLYLIVFPLYFRHDRYLLNIAITSSILSCISLGVWLTFSIGRINIGQGAFAAFGGYTTAILMTKVGLSFWLCLPLSGVVAAFVGFLIGLPVLRLKGVYFAMISLSLTETARLLFLNTPSLTNGGDGIMNIPWPGELSIAGITLIPAFDRSNYLSFYYLAAFVLLLTLLAVWRLYSCRIGWIFRTLRQSDTLALSSGISIVKYRIIAYCICCFIGGIGGSLFTVFIQNIFPASFKVNDSVYFMLYCFLGGLDYFVGPIVGAFSLTALFELLRAIQKYQEGIYALLMIVLMLWLPNGLLSLRFGKKSGEDEDTSLKPDQALKES
ncbi:branched-chain amino acid ABC transporter permease [candidate division KSB3 bacterium]|uniref:Branched-chain amino acid ABC transporter permease n=1 Tax=candidate division KSB3 bacterium TaxID=2044937 RepID=A0A9D5Q475_9BACT|nr:branched-chain amino acid ABC transporter permease [candidate division KSB3 bacterium]MBD3322948.1 branched-chain amino acid ABC transporter permease [candidate division KSB3 bacterium]